MATAEPESPALACDVDPAVVQKLAESERDRLQAPEREAATSSEARGFEV